MTRQKKLRGLNGTLNEDVKFTHEQITDALYYLDDVMDRAQIPFFLLEGAAKQIHDDLPYFSLNQIDAGVPEQYVQKTGKEFLKIVIPDVYFDDNTISFVHNSVPIIVWIIHKKWKFFQNPDTVFFGITSFKLPNPFKSYWRARFLIK
jgi:hypothetical protein